ncbi:MAG: hypothetical protein ACJ77E_18495 [Gaiellaceae bacterium]
MKRSHLVVALAAVVATSLLVPLAGTAAGPADVTCPQDTMQFTGTAHDLTVPAGGFCQITGATITHDLIQEANAGADILNASVGHDVVFQDEAGAGFTNSSVAHDVVAAGFGSGADFSRSTIGHDFLGLGEASGTDLSNTTVGHDVRLLGAGGGAHMELTKIGHDFFASSPESIQSGRNGPSSPGGTVVVGHDFTIVGSPDSDFVFDGLCNLNVGRDVAITDRTVNLGIGLGSICAGNGEPANTVGRDLILTNDHAVSGFFGPSSINVGANHVGRDLVFTGNTAAPGGKLNVSGNVIGRDATCTGNDPAVTVDTPNVAARSNTCG